MNFRAILSSAAVLIFIPAFLNAVEVPRVIRVASFTPLNVGHLKTQVCLAALEKLNGEPEDPTGRVDFRPVVITAQTFDFENTTVLLSGNMATFRHIVQNIFESRAANGEHLISFRSSVRVPEFVDAAEVLEHTGFKGARPEATDSYWNLSSLELYVFDPKNFRRFIPITVSPRSITNIDRLGDDPNSVQIGDIQTVSPHLVSVAFTSPNTNLLTPAELDAIDRNVFDRLTTHSWISYLVGHPSFLTHNTFSAAAENVKYEQTIYRVTDPADKTKTIGYLAYIQTEVPAPDIFKNRIQLDRHGLISKTGSGTVRMLFRFNENGFQVFEANSRPD